ncbi:unnamed protein product [Schistosoma margrebowiei]|uniref:Uncharacterized protein n=1 Tax=Schistosoma margrebowiei TaxID=48269 RepID=A0A3P8E8R7_9TREM|nr:unnamed protein product [Schistosoma margrebowiei]
MRLISWMYLHLKVDVHSATGIQYRSIAVLNINEKI